MTEATPTYPEDDRNVENTLFADDSSIRAYLDVTDDGEIARLAAMMAPKRDCFDAHSLVAMAAALQKEAAAELVRRREVIVSSMDYDTLLRLAEHLGFRDLGFLPMVNEESLTDPVEGPVLRRLSGMIKALPPRKEFNPDFNQDFRFDNYGDALNIAASRTKLPRPRPGESLESILRFASNIPTEEVSWEILNGSFIDFLRIWYCGFSLPADLIPSTDCGITPLEAFRNEFEQLPPADRADLHQIAIDDNRHQKEVESFHQAFKPGQTFAPDINGNAHRALLECWESIPNNLSLYPKIAWLVVEFTPFWQRHGAAYRAIDQDRIKKDGETAALIEAEQQKISKQFKAKAKQSNYSKAGVRWKTVTANFIEFLDKDSGQGKTLDLQISAADFVRSTATLGKKRDRERSLEFLGTLCAAVTAERDATFVVEILEQSRFKSLQGDMVGECLRDLKNAQKRVEGKKIRKKA